MGAASLAFGLLIERELGEGGRREINGLGPDSIKRETERKDERSEE